MAIINNPIMIIIANLREYLLIWSVSLNPYDRRIFHKDPYADAIALQPVIGKRPQTICGIGILEIRPGRHYLHL
jgi:hypothetical protein